MRLGIGRKEKLNFINFNITLFYLFLASFIFCAVDCKETASADEEITKIQPLMSAVCKKQVPEKSQISLKVGIKTVWIYFLLNIKLLIEMPMT